MTGGQNGYDAREFHRKALEGLRAKLIDLSKRNRLLNFKHSERGAGFIRVVDELPDVLSEKLRAGSMGFQPLPDPEDEPADEKTPEFQIALEAARLTDPDYLAATAEVGEAERDAEAFEAAEKDLRARLREKLGLPPLTRGRSLDVANFARANGFDPSYDLPEATEQATADHHDDNLITVLFTREQLDRKLRGIHDKNRTLEAETGIHTLQIAFGFLEWREPASPEEPYFAPLLLMPVQLSKRLVRGHHVYELSAPEEDFAVNIALQELLRDRYRVELPTI